MDVKLLDQLKKITNMYKLSPTEDISLALKDIQSRINVLAEGLYKLKLEKITNDITFNHQIDLLKSIKDLGQIVLLLINQQKKNDSATRIAMKTGNNSMYFNRKERKQIESQSIEDNSNINKEIEGIVLKRKNDYIKAFGYFESKEKADTIIKKEYDDVIHYLDILLKINELKYNDYDNYDPLINVCQNLMYELSQLAIVLMKAQESRIVETINNSNINNLSAYFLIMDFVNSRELYPDKLYILAENIREINRLICNSGDIGMLCKMGLYKQDEVQGIFVGDYEKFIDVMKRNLVRDAKIGACRFGLNDNQTDIINLVDCVYEDPFVFAGPTTWRAREIIEKNPTIVKTLRQ